MMLICPSAIDQRHFRQISAIRHRDWIYAGSGHVPEAVIAIELMHFDRCS
jgi:hypothetical protein